MADPASELEAIARRLRFIGDGELTRELRRAISDAAGRVPDDIRAGLKPRLPDPYAEVLDADLAFSIRQRASDRDPGVTLRATTRSGQRRRIRRLDQGILAHPLYGHRKRWYNQGEPSVQPGWFSGPAEAARPRVREEIKQALRDVAAKATGKGS